MVTSTLLLSTEGRQVCMARLYYAVRPSLSNTQYVRCRNLQPPSNATLGTLGSGCDSHNGQHDLVVVNIAIV